MVLKVMNAVKAIYSKLKINILFANKMLKAMYANIMPKVI